MTNSNNTLFSLEHAQKSFGSNQVLKDISMQVKEGEVVAIIGPSGGGKSTLLRCATMLETLDSGQMNIGGLQATTINSAGKAVYAPKATLQQAKMKLGLVFQSFNLFPHYTVLKNITSAPMLVQKRDAAEVETLARQLIAKMGLEGKEDMVPCELSGGQQQRVAIARALCMQPDILFFDEPTSALDPELTQEVLKVIRSLAEERMTMVIVTHEMTFARDVADYIIFMDEGVIAEQGPAQELINNPKSDRLKSFLSKISD